MTRKIFLALGALAALQLSAGVGIASDSAAVPVSSRKLPAPELREKVLALFISAMMEKDPDQRCIKLVDVIAADPDNAETPLAAFAAAFSKAKKTEKILEKFDAAQKAAPEHPLLALHALSLHNACGLKGEQLLEKASFLLSLPPAKLVNHPAWNIVSTNALLITVSQAMMETGNFAQLSRLFKKWDAKVPQQHRFYAHLVLAEPCFTSAARAYALNRAALGKELEECFNEALATFKSAETLPPDRKRDSALLLFYIKFKPLLKNKALEFARQYDRRVNSIESNEWLMNSAMECGSIADLDKAAAAINELNPRFNAAEQRIKCFINARDFAAAAREVEKAPEEKRYELQIRLYTAKEDWKGLYDFISERLSKGTAPDLQTGVLLLTIAEKFGDKNIFFQGQKIISSHLHVPELANAAGYISAVLGIELPFARQLLTAALKQQPRNAAFLDSMAWIAFKEKRYAEAEKWIKEAFLNMRPREGAAVILEHAGDIAAAQGKSPLPYYRLSLKYGAFDNEFKSAAVIKKMKAFK